MRHVFPACMLCVLFVIDHAAGESCAVYGCTAHKVSDHACQCNVHCLTHKDCCADYATACSRNETEAAHHHTPHLSPHNETEADEGKAGKAAVETSDKGSTKGGQEKSGTKESGAKESAKESAKETKAKEGAKDAGKDSGKDAGKDAKGAAGKEASKAKAAKPPPSPSSHSSHPSSGSHQAVSHASGSHSSGHASNGHPSAHPSTHSSSHSSHSSSSAASSHVTHHSKLTWWLVVGLACVTGLTVPIIISAILVLRANGVCCARKFEPVARSESASMEPAEEMSYQPKKKSHSSIPFPELQPSAGSSSGAHV
eukprot:CAMPEP_0182842638 /NCGR_PEP_ID=MMETSP0006_2-20121128/25739_1 /TAXON_ID=97485 /ORGANISM="Prymnesium parvum, Strain Texoma1" /LENGTH=311 /DNA_ID=CAMNT_0024972333 /DNA_START=355 /DNA_END=1290 /DNA_ORIENTATION=+